jgi:3D (Asp-Asp-Asp) domain-containing protein
MSRRVLEFLALALVFFATASTGWAEETVAKKESALKLKVRTTAYTHTESDHVTYGNKTALGTVLRYTPEYHSAAADWSYFPLGTKFKIKGYDRLFVVDDYGSALVGKPTIDIYFTTKKWMKNWGVRHVEVEVIEFGSFHESRKILAGRGTYPHCLAMLRRMTQDKWYENFQK